MTQEEAICLRSRLEKAISQNRLLDSPYDQLRKDLDDLLEARTVLLAAGANPNWYDNMRKAVIEAMNLKRIEEQGDEQLKVGKCGLIWTIVTLAAVILFGVIQCRASRHPPTQGKDSSSTGPSQTQTPAPESSARPKP